MIASPPEIKKKGKLSDPQIDIYNSCKERVLFMSGQGGGKTFIGGNVSLKLITKFPQAIGFIGANTFDQLNTSTLKRFFEVWQLFGVTNEINYVVDKIPPAKWPQLHPRLKSYKNTICFDNGCLVFTRSMDNYTAIDGIELSWAFLDETKDTKEDAIKDVIVGRLRQPAIYVTPDGKLTDRPTGKGYNPLFILTSPAKVLWINEWFGMPDYYEEINAHIFSETDYFMRETERELVVICSTYHNQHNLSPGKIESMLADFKGNDHKKDMLIYGSPIAKTGGEFYHAWNRLKHIGKTQYNPDAYLDVSFDFNVVPYISATVSQILWDEERNKYIVQFIKEYALEAPRNNSEDLSNAILLDWQKHKTGVRIFGDASGKNRQTVSKEFRHNYAVIEHILRPILAADYNKVTRSNPALIKRRDFANKMLAGGYDIEIVVDPSCKKTITDFEFVKEAPDGGKLKEMTKDSHTGESYQKLGHHSDAVDYFLCSAFENYFNPG